MSKTSLAMFVCMLLSWQNPMKLHAEQFGDYTYSNSGSGVTITGYTGPRDYGSGIEVSLPATINGLPLTGIGHGAFSNWTGLVHMTLPVSVSSIGSGAFSNCTRMTHIAIPNGVSRIESNTFNLCSSLGQVSIPSSVTSIGNAAFYDCGLESISIPDGVTNVGEYVFFNCCGLTSITIPQGVRRIASGLCQACSSLKTVNLPGNIFSIGSNAFSDCGELIKIAIPKTVTNIEAGAFAGCGKLASITLPDGLLSIGNSAFYGTRLSRVTIPSGVTEIGDETFCWCDRLSNVTLSTNVTRIGANAFDGCSSLAQIKIPDGVTSIGQYAFAQSGLVRATIPKTVTNIGMGAHLWCGRLLSISADPDNLVYSSLKGVLFNKDQTVLISYPAGKLGAYSIPSSVTRVGENAFGGCTQVTAVTIPNSVTSVGGGAFADCESLTKIVVPSSVTNIESSAFSDCFWLIQVSIPDTVPCIGDYAFYSCIRLRQVVVPNGVTNIGNCAFYGCARLTNVAFSQNVREIGSSAFSCTRLAEVTLPESLVRIGDHAFASCSNLTRVHFPESVTDIGNSAFSLCDRLSNLNLPGHLAKIGDLTFSWCSALQSIAIPDSVTAIGNSAFYECITLTDVGLGRGLTNIGSKAFQFCVLLNRIVIPGSVNSIGQDAFLFDYHGKVYFEGNAPLIASSKTRNFGAATLYYLQGSAGWGSKFDGYIPVRIGAPIILRQYEPEAYLGGTVSLGVETEGPRPLTYQWMRFGRKLADDGHFSGTTSAILTVSKLLKGDAGYYDLRVSNAWGIITNTLWLAVVDGLPPSIAITSHWDLETVSTSPITLSGTASDASYGDNGVVAVTVNDVRAKNDSAEYEYQANWTKTVRLAVGANKLAVVAKDGVNNTVTNTIRIILDPARPTLSITNLVRGRRYSDPIFTVRGWARDNLALSNVWYQLNGSPWTLAGGTTSWSGVLTFTTVSNTVRAFAVDVAGNHSATNTVSFLYSPTNLAHALPTDKTYNRGDFIQGIYTGLFAPTNSVREQFNSGFFSLAVTSEGAISGVLTIGKDRIPIAGVFDSDGEANLELGKQGSRSLKLVLSVDAETGRVIGSLSDGLWNSALHGDRAVFTMASPATNYAGQYSLTLHGTGDLRSESGLGGYGTVNIDLLGGVTFVGRLTDGTAFMSRSAISKDGVWPIYVPVFDGKGSVWGWGSLTGCAPELGGSEGAATGTYAAPDRSRVAVPFEGHLERVAGF